MHAHFAFADPLDKVQIVLKQEDAHTTTPLVSHKAADLTPCI